MLSCYERIINYHRTWPVLAFEIFRKPLRLKMKMNRGIINRFEASFERSVAVSFDLYFRRMKYSSDSPKTVLFLKESVQVARIDPPYRMHKAYYKLTISPLFN